MIENLSEKIYHKFVRMSKDPKDDSVTFVKFIKLEDAQPAINKLIERMKYLVPNNDELGIMVQESIMSIFGDVLCTTSEPEDKNE